jgi:hypothetical protein
MTHLTKPAKDPAVSHLISYIVFSAILVTFTVLIMLTIPSLITKSPSDQLISNAFTDIGNGISTRIVDVHSIRPSTGDISSKIDFPREIINRNFRIQILGGGSDIKLSQGSISTFTPLPGISLGGEGITGDIASNSLRKITYISTEE